MLSNSTDLSTRPSGAYGELVLGTAAAAAAMALARPVEDAVDFAAAWLARFSTGTRAAGHARVARRSAERDHDPDDFRAGTAEPAMAGGKPIHASVLRQDYHLLQLDHLVPIDRLIHRLRHCMDKMLPVAVGEITPEQYCASDVRHTLRLQAMLPELEQFWNAWNLISESVDAMRANIDLAAQRYAYLAPFILDGVWTDIKNKALDAALKLPMPADGLSRFQPAAYQDISGVSYTVEEVATRAKYAAAESTLPISPAELDGFYESFGHGIIKPLNGTAWSLEEMKNIASGILTVAGKREDLTLLMRYLPPGVRYGSLVPPTVYGAASLMYSKGAARYVNVIAHPAGSSRLQASKQFYNWVNPDSGRVVPVGLYVSPEGRVYMKCDGDKAWESLVFNDEATVQRKCLAFEKFVRQFDPMIRDRMLADRKREEQERDAPYRKEIDRLYANPKYNPAWPFKRPERPPH